MPRAYWLVKSEPSVYPWSKLVAEKSATWDGIRSYEARNNLRAMKKGDLAFFYHSNEGKSVVGIARVKSEAYQDPTTDEDWSVVDLEPVKAMAREVSLEEMRGIKALANMSLVKKSRLSVSPVTKEEWAAVLAAGKTKVA
ncbi:MAG TPA: EVE domain-containing protein [Polyangiaceae bacterium]|jgi:predicted RNA-binding protein with PUA-like domain